MRPAIDTPVALHFDFDPRSIGFASKIVPIRTRRQAALDQLTSPFATAKISVTLCY
jgi:hypothetical protein